MFLYPRLPLYVASSLASENATRSVEDLRTLSRSTEHPTVWYAPTGGHKVTGSHLRQLQNSVRELAKGYGYPGSSSVDEWTGFDASCGGHLHAEMGLAPSEASHIGVWWFITCVLLPDIVRWRFPGNGETALERFIGSSRGMRRNAFGRLWWRAFLLNEPSKDKPYGLLSMLTEDELVQITERPSLAGSPRLAKEIANAFLRAQDYGRNISRREIIRDGIKRIRRMYSMISFELLEDDELRESIDGAFVSSAKNLGVYAEPAANEHGPQRAAPAAQPSKELVSSDALDSELTWQDISTLDVGERKWLADRDAKRRLNRILSAEGFKSEYSAEGRYTDWTSDSLNFRVLHNAQGAEDFSRAVERTA